LLRITIAYISVALCIVWTGTYGILIFLAYLIRWDWGQALLRIWATVILKAFGIHTEVSGLENLPKGHGAVFAANHESNFDALVLCLLPIHLRWVAKRELKKVPIIGWTLWAMGAFFVNRDRTEKDLNVMKGVEDGVRAGAFIVIFPEGTRTRTGEMLPFKKGAFRTAQNSGVPICPVAIRGTFEIAPPGKLPTRRGHRVAVKVGKPFPVAAGADLTEVMERFRSELIRLRSEIRLEKRRAPGKGTKGPQGQ
jgi:1-acyl-sn-glycerol-3-phosphate acyltransferase